MDQKQSTEVELKGNKTKDRERWSSPIEFLLSCIAMSVGLGNVWRFPSVAYKNGGGAFLLPYIVVLVILGKPFYYLELALGQFTSYGCVGVWNVSPAFRGVGYGQMVASAAVVSYYVSIMAFTIFYLIACFTTTLPWTECDPDLIDITNCLEHNMRNNSQDAQNLTSNQISPADAYFTFEVQKTKDTLHEGLSLPDWRLVLCLLFSWLAILFTLVRGVKSSGKVAYFTALFPYVVLLLLLLRGVTLPGAFDGILLYLKPDWAKMMRLEVWTAAVVQCFFSLSVGFGVISMYASFNEFRHNVHRDAMIISFMDMGTSFLAGLTTFAVLGNLAHETQTPIDHIAQESVGVKLAFITFPTALANFPGVPQLFSVLFFLMLFTLGLGSATALTGCSVTVVCDRFPRIARWKVTSAICTCGFLIGIVYVTPEGGLVLDLVDMFGAGFVVMILALLEITVLSWVYGVDKLARDIGFMLGREPSIYWKICWRFCAPIILCILVVYSLTGFSDQFDDSKYNMASLVGGFSLSLLALIPVPLCFALALFKSEESGILQKLRSIVKPNGKWGPMLEENRTDWSGTKAEVDLELEKSTSSMIASVPV